MQTTSGIGMLLKMAGIDGEKLQALAVDFGGIMNDIRDRLTAIEARLARMEENQDARSDHADTAIGSNGVAADRDAAKLPSQ